MKKVAAVLTIALTLSSVAMARTKVVYGVDNRKDIHEVTNQLHLNLAKSTAGMVHAGIFKKAAEPNFFDLAMAPSLERSMNVCTSESFSQQLTAPNCSGFLVGPDTIVTAGHCYAAFDLPENVCQKFAWIFDYQMSSAEHDPTLNISISNVYLCKKVVSIKLDKDFDYAIIKLDRPVVGREPLKFRSSGKLDNNANLVVIGHPSGLPTKVSDGGKVTDNSSPTRFASTLDTFQGNSGSAVFDAETGLVEGVLIQGKTDYQLSGGCRIVNVCDENAMNCTAGDDGPQMAAGEIVQRIDSFSNDLEQALKNI